MNIWIWYGYVLMCVHVYQYVHVYLYVSALCPQTQRAKTKIYKTYIVLAGESLNLMEPQNGYQELSVHR